MGVGSPTGRLLSPYFGWYGNMLIHIIHRSEGNSFAKWHVTEFRIYHAQVRGNGMLTRTTKEIFALFC